MTFETHITVDAASDRGVLEEIAERNSARTTEIVLARGQVPVQPMVTFNGDSSLQSELRRAEKFEQQLRSGGLNVVRTKVETDLETAYFAPGSKRAVEPPQWLYAEQHVRVRLHATDADVDRLKATALILGAHLSFNARSSIGDLEERFVTSRVYNNSVNFPAYTKRTIDSWLHRDYRTLKSHFDSVVSGLRDAGWGIVSTDRELVLHDTNFALDNGWLPDSPLHLPVSEPIQQAPSLWPDAWTLPTDPSLDQPRLFDPSMKHMTNAFRRGNPTGEDSEAWLDIRTRLFNHILSEVAASPLRDSLCLRGSVLLSRYLGTASRVPGDIDWVVLPATTEMNDEHGIGILEALKTSLSNLHFDDAELQVGGAVADSIWTYDRVPGRRLTIPWVSHAGAPGTVQMDFVYGEELWTPPIKIHLGDDSENYLTAASPELSLAWKLLWLVSDIHPQGKDLYDAVLLAEEYDISPDLVDRAFEEGSPRRRTKKLAGRAAIEAWSLNSIEWDDFIKEYPEVTGTADRWKERLADALFPHS